MPQGHATEFVDLLTTLPRTEFTNSSLANTLVDATVAYLYLLPLVQVRPQHSCLFAVRLETASAAGLPSVHSPSLQIQLTAYSAL